MRPAVVRCSVLGRTEIEMPGIRLTPESERQFGLALFYCVHAGREVPRDEVAALFWPEHGEEAARHCLRQALYRLRALGIPVRSGAKATALSASCVEADYAPVVAEGASLQAYLGLTDATVLPGYTPRFSVAFADWVERFRNDLAARLRRGLVRAIADARSRGRYGEVERLARLCLTLDPLNEEATLALAEAVALAGGKAEAVGMIDRYVSEVGGHKDIRIPAEILRTRVSELIVSEEPYAHEPALIGRESELEALLSMFSLCQKRREQFVHVSGEAGVGKTALVTEFLRIVSLRECSIVRVACQQLDSERPLAVLAQIVAGLFRCRGALGAAAETLSILQALTSWESGLSPEQPSSAIQLQLGQVQGAFEDLIQALLDEAPLVLFVDDIHRIDPRSLGFLNSLTGQLRGRPLMVVACSRAHLSLTERDVRSFSHINLHNLRVYPLPATQATLLLRQLLGSSGNGMTDERIQELVEVSGGNALFLSQLARHLRDAHGRETLPESLRSLLVSRLHTLTPGGLLTLQACSCLGTFATVPRLERVLQLRAHALLQSLTQLEEAGLIDTRESSIRCRHDLVAQVTAESTPSATLILLHRRAARVMETDAAATGDPTLLWQSAQHCESAKQPRDARRVLDKLGRYLMRIGAPADATRAFTRAIGYCESWNQQLQITDHLLAANRASRDWAAISATLKLRRQLEQTLGIPRRHAAADTLMEFEVRFRLTRDMRDELPLVVRQLEDGQYDDSQRAALVLMGLIMADNLIDPEGAERIFACLPGPESLRNDQLGTSARMIFHTTFGDLDLALAHADDLRRTCLASGLRDVRTMQRLRWTAVPLLYAGRFEECCELLSRVVEESRRTFLWGEAGTTAVMLAEVAVQRSDLAGALRWAAGAREFASRTNDELLKSDASAVSALTALLGGDSSAARSAFAEAALYRAHRPERRVRARSLSLKLAVDCVAGELDEPQVAELESLVRDSMSYGDFDLIVTVLSRLIARRGDPSTSEILLSRYAEARRERYPMPRIFERLLADDPGV